MITWNEVNWPRPMAVPPLIGLLTRLASDQQRGPLVWEARAEEGRIRYLVGADKADLRETSRLLIQFVPDVSITPLLTARSESERCGRVRIKQRSLSLNLQATEQMLQALLGALASTTGKGDVLVIQVILDRALRPESVSRSIEDPTMSIWEKLVRGSRPASGDVKTRLAHKLGEYRFRAVVRVGVAAGHPVRRIEAVHRVLAAFRQLQSGGAHVDLVPDKADAVDEARIPMLLPLRLTPNEALSFLAWPHGNDELPGMPALHPRPLPPPSSFIEVRNRAFAVTTAPGPGMQIGISRNDSFRHTHIVGPTGVGKSNLMLNLIKADIAAGMSVVLIDPKGDLAMDTLAQIPEKRQRDVVVIDPTLPMPVGINPLAATRDRHALVTDGILAVFKGLFPTAFGPRTTDILHASLLTLMASPDATLMKLPALLTDAQFRRSLTEHIYDPIGLGPFWAQWEAMTPGQQAEAIGPVMSRLRQFLLRPSLRTILDQANPKFQFSEIFTKSRIVIVSLNKGLIGTQSATLLGSLVVSQLWQLALAQAGLTPEQRRPVSVYIDEAQTFLHLDADLGEALEQSRSLKVAWHLAHQFRHQMPADLLAGIDANTRNKVVFTLEHADAKAVASGSDLLPADFESLPPYGIYASLLSRGLQTGWISGRTFPPPELISDPNEVIRESQVRYGSNPPNPSESISESDPASTSCIDDESFGRRPRGATS